MNIHDRDEIKQLEARVAALTAERDEFRTKFHHAMETLTAWPNVEKAEAMLRADTLQARVAALAAALMKARAYVNAANDNWARITVKEIDGALDAAGGR